MKPRAITERQIYEARVMHRKLGWSYARIGEVLGVNPGTIRFQLNKDFLRLCRDVVHYQDMGIGRWLSEAFDKADEAA